MTPFVRPLDSSQRPPFQNVSVPQDSTFNTQKSNSIFYSFIYLVLRYFFFCWKFAFQSKASKLQKSSVLFVCVFVYFVFFILDPYLKGNLNIPLFFHMAQKPQFQSLKSGQKLVHKVTFLFRNLVLQDPKFIISST